MKSRFVMFGLTGMVLTFGLSVAQAGAIRATGKQIGKTSKVVAGATANAADGVASAGKATGSAIKGGAPTAGKVVVAAPGAAARGTSRAGKAIVKAVW